MGRWWMQAGYRVPTHAGKQVPTKGARTGRDQDRGGGVVDGPDQLRQRMLKRVLLYRSSEQQRGRGGERGS